ncbi:MAG: glycosyltransferase family 2 protein [Opitutae bacterium]|nr:glycosyltransferase family 2 protein [Opitutae bacterium]
MIVSESKYVRFSVVIPLYNKEKHIAGTIKSVLEQFFRDFEIVVVNDGSTDDSLKVAKSIQDSRIRIISKSNGGVSSARNRGIAEAKNEWIALLDADDAWLPNHLENLAKAISLFPEHKVFFTGFTRDVRPDYTPWCKNFAVPVENYFKLANSGKVMFSSSSAFHASIAMEMPMFREDLTRGEDIDLWTRLAKKYVPVLVGEVSAIYFHCAENRATMRSRVLEKSMIWHVKISQISDKDEKEYFRKQYYIVLDSVLFTRNFWQILRRQKYYGFFRFWLWLFNKNLSRLLRFLSRRVRNRK